MRRLKVFTVILCLMGLSVNAEARKKPRAEKLKESVDMLKAEAAPPPTDGEVCFSPEEHCDLRLIKFVETAQKSLDIAIYDINLDHLVHTLLVKAKKIPVRIVVDRRQSKGQHSLVSTLIKAGAQIRYGKQRSIFHNKFTVVDGKMIETGSFNYTYNASHNNHENQIYLSNPKVVERFKSRFEKIWSEAFHVEHGPGTKEATSSSNESEE